MSVRAHGAHLEKYWEAVHRWAAALAAWRQALRRASQWVQPADADAWREAQRQLELADVSLFPAEESLPIAALAAAHLRRAADAVGGAARVLASPAMFAVTGQTVTEERAAGLRAERAAAAEHAAAHAAALAAAAAAGAACAALSADHGADRGADHGAIDGADHGAALSADHGAINGAALSAESIIDCPAKLDGEVAAALFVNAVRCAAEHLRARFARGELDIAAVSSGEIEAAKQTLALYDRELAAAPDGALGIPADSREAAAHDAATLSKYHPLQALNEEVPGFTYTKKEGVSNCPACQIDIRLPTATRDVEYDLARLIDGRYATQFGPIQTQTSGLNYHLVQRLQTVKTTPRATLSAPPDTPLSAPPDTPLSEPSDTAAPCAVPDAPRCEPICRAGDRLQFVGTKLRSAAQPHDRAFLAGARPRALALAALLAATAVRQIEAEDGMGAGRARRAALQAKFDARVRADPVPAGAPGKDLIVAALVKAFEAELDADFPAGLRDYYTMATGEPAAEPAGYITMAFARLAQQYPAMPAAAAREAAQTRMLSACGAAHEFQRHLTKQFSVQRPGLDAFQGAAGSAAAKPALRSHLLAGYRKAAAAAAADCVALPVAPSLKLYSATLAI